MADLAVSAALHLFQEVSSFLGREANLQKDESDTVQKIRSLLLTLQALLKDAGGNVCSETRETLISQVRDLAYDVEDALDEFKLHVRQKFHRHRLSRYAESAVRPFKHWHALRKLSSKVQGINGRMNDIIKLYNFSIYSAEEGSSSGTSVELYHQTPKEGEMVGFEEHKETLIHHLVGDSRSMLKKIWVVGLGGSGKTILVKNVFESKNVLKQYDCHAWIHVSRPCKINEVLRSMLKQFCKPREESNLPGEDIGARLRDHLEQRRYLLVLDDIWSKDDWERIINALPQASGGSGIVTTSQNLNVVQSCGATSSDTLKLEGLAWKQACDLFCKKAFPSNKGGCPRELEELSQNIVKKCEGLPLAIAAIGSLLSTKRQTPAEWTTLLDSLGSEIGHGYNLASISRVFLSSYKDQSNNLKNCFLYFSILPEDYSIGRGRLIRLWIAEGFIKERSGKTLEAVAEDYLNELVGRNVVDVSQWDFDGRVMLPSTKSHQGIHHVEISRRKFCQNAFRITFKQFG